MFIGLGSGRRRINELYQEIEEKRPNIFRCLKCLKLKFDIPSESSMMFGEDVVCILWVRDGWSIHLQEMVHSGELCKSQLRTAPVLGRVGGKEERFHLQQNHSSSFIRLAFQVFCAEAPGCPHLTAHQCLSQDMECQSTKDCLWECSALYFMHQESQWYL